MSLREASLLDKGLREELREILTHRAIKAALRELLETADARNKLVGLNLTTTEGVALANARQGYAEGIYATLDALYDMAEPEDEEVENEPNANDEQTI